QYLFESYFKKTASIDERDELSGILNATTNKSEVLHLFEESWRKYKSDEVFISDEKSEKMLQHIFGRELAPVRRFKWLSLAAAVILAFLIIGYFMVINEKTVDSAIVSLSMNDVNPGSYKASLKLD